jgi:hypothetical protein
MSKAFDKINILRLQNSCKRIGIPQTAINFITNLHTDRQARIITGYGLTEPISLYSGIEQGETYSPLLWKINYDPILTYINSTYQNSFLKISSQSLIEKINYLPPSQITIPPLAFMDDTVWHSQNKEALQNILNDTCELYQINNIQINTEKCDLIHLNPPKKTNSQSNYLTFNNTLITPRKNNEVIRYLGIYYDGKGTTKPTIEKIISKTNSILNTIRYKKLLPLHISRIINTILNPSLEYLFQIVSPTKNLITKLSSQITIQTKYSLSLSKNTLNNILINPYSLNLQLPTHTYTHTSLANIERSLNSHNILKEISLIRIKE